MAAQRPGTPRILNLRGLACACALCIATACSGEERPPAEPAPVQPAAPATAPAQTAAPPTPPQAELEPSAEELPVREDFQPEAEQLITAASYRAALDKLEQEINADAP